MENRSFLQHADTFYFNCKITAHAVHPWLKIYGLCEWTIQEVGVNQPLLKRGNPPVSQLPPVTPPDTCPTGNVS